MDYSRLAGKKLLLVMPKFHGYHLSVLAELKKLQLAVSNVFFDSSVVLGETDKSVFVENVMSEVENLVNDDYFDYLLVVNNALIKPHTLKAFKLKNPNSATVMYLWDSLKNHEAMRPSVLSILSQFDRCYSFEYEDCCRHTELNLIHRPLFFHPYAKEVTPIKSCEFDVSFVNSAMPTRIDFINKFSRRYKHLKTHFHLYFASIKSIPVYLINHGVIVKPKDFKRKTLTIFQTIDILNNSNCCLDIPADYQKGLSIGVFNILALNKKLITTNQDISKYDFFNPNNILVIPPYTLEDIDSFIKKPYDAVPDDIVEKYSIAFWAKSMLLNETVIYCK